MDAMLAALLDKVLSEEISTPCPYHPAGRNKLWLNPLERQILIERIRKVLEECR